MSPIKKIIVFLLLLASVNNYAQLGFCTGSKGDPIFSENFGNGTTYGPALPAGTTTYPFVTGAPNDGQYTLYYQSSLYTTWHYSLDHTPDATNGPNGKMLLMNANAVTSGDFYKKTVTGLCVNTTFEFSAWLMNVYNPNTNYCGAGQIPINVRFEIWNDTETVLLGSGNTGNIFGSSAPLWQQFALVFTTTSETSVVLKMKNNGVGGCGNDLAIDDIMFSACGDLTTVSSPTVTGDTYTTCTNPTSLQLDATTLSAVPYFYQWQTSTDATSWTDITGATSSTYTTPNLSSATYFRVRAAQDAANLGNPFCSSISNVFTVNFLPTPTAATNDGDKTICSNQTIPSLSVTAASGTNVNWYSAATGGILLQSASTTYTPTAAGIYYAETYNATTNCINTSRTAVELTIIPLPDVTISGATTLCSGNTATITFNGTPDAIVTYNINGGSDQTITLNASGSASITTSPLSASVTYTLVSCTSADLSSCSRPKNDSVTVTVTNVLSASFSSNSPVCYGTPATLNFTGTPNTIVTYAATGGPNQTVTLNAGGTASASTSNVTTAVSYTLSSVASTGSSPCTQTLNQSITVSSVPLPTVSSINASPTAVCSGQTSTVTFTGTPDAVITYTVNGGSSQSITLNAGGTASVTTLPLSVATTYQLTNIILPATGCTQSLTNSVAISINPTPTAAYTGDLNYCEGESILLNLSSTVAGTTFDWTVSQSGTNGATAGSGNQINQNVTLTGNSAGTVTYTVTPLYNGCSGNPITITVNILPLPIPGITDGVICRPGSGLPSTQFYTLDTNLSAADHTFQWYLDSDLIPGASSNTYDAYQIGTYTVIATNSAGCISLPVDAVVGERPQGESLVIEQSAAFSDNPTITVTVVGGGGPFSYQLDDFYPQSSNVFHSVLAGTHTITVVDDYCTLLTATVTILDYPKYFTPNGDGIHDTWNIDGITNASIHIFDRYGKLLKQISPEGLGWDGTYNGHQMPSSDYWFTIDYFENGASKTFRAHFAMKR
ncbi:T9SS type B sorting domain-containing protein [Flavobacterium silvaticum]|uniref:T9SS type B sorting domain-containing protein n=1 Tax=Flavobacterium silvaticum TaxID=1852020 RepID=A0A972JG40_9FLAO|nr:T9SS type B sorting domain-containing protein [Flavobacterium silvaticum]NMH28649.1 T9SS type B sorting domain-containing protein [Flavobacterium silvaticum]